MSKMAKARVFVPLTKVDEEQRLVFGRITQEMMDKASEVMDYESSKPHFEKWSNDIHTASNGLSKGNVRVMHGLTAAGKLTELDFDDEDKAIDVCAKVVDDAEWNKCLEGVYTGFSVGGSYAKRWSETVDGTQVKKFTAKPNEVSLVDNPCVPSATFTMMKADGTEEAIAFQVENDDAEWPGFAKADSADGTKKADEPEAGVTNDDDKQSPPKKEKKPVTANKADVAPVTITNDMVSAKAEELAKAANDGSTWMSHIEDAREELTKTTALEVAASNAKADEPSEGEETPKEGVGDEVVEEKTPNDDATITEKGTPAGVVQKWNTSDGQAFDKKADAVAHEESLIKAATPQTDAEILADRLRKAMEPEVDAPSVLEDFDRLEKVFNALSTPFEEGAPKLEKGMYSINRFSNVLSDMASLSRSIKAEAAREGGDENDKAVSEDLIGCVKSLGKSFIDYAKNQIEELLAGVDDEVLVSTYDYYYAAAKDDSSNQMAKDICAVIDENREAAGERREELMKAFVELAPVEEADVLSPPMAKRFTDLETENAELKKVAGEAVEKVEELAKRMQAIEDSPMPRAPRESHVIDKNGTFMGKAAGTEEEKMDILKDLLATHGADGLATMMIKASHATGGVKMGLTPA